MLIIESITRNFSIFSMQRPYKEKYQNQSEESPPLPATTATIGVETYKLEVTENRESFWMHSSLLTSSNKKSSGGSRHRKLGTGSGRTASSASSQLRRSSSVKLKQVLQVRVWYKSNIWVSYEYCSLDLIQFFE